MKKVIYTDIPDPYSKDSFCLGIVGFVLLTLAAVLACIAVFGGF